TFLGREGFRRGIDKYFELYDGQAVTTDDFIHAMEIANGKDFSQFKHWYQSAGTPILTLTSHFDAKKKTYELTIEQKTSGHPLQMPLRVALFDRQQGKKSQEVTLDFKRQRQSFIFEQVENDPLLSFNRGFSAPIILK